LLDSRIQFEKDIERMTMDVINQHVMELMSKTEELDNKIIELSKKSDGIITVLKEIYNIFLIKFKKSSDNKPTSSSKSQEK